MHLTVWTLILNCLPRRIWSSPLRYAFIRRSLSRIDILKLLKFLNFWYKLTMDFLLSFDHDITAMIYTILIYCNQCIWYITLTNRVNGTWHIDGWISGLTVVFRYIFELHIISILNNSLMSLFNDRWHTFFSVINFEKEKNFVSRGSMFWITHTFSIL